MLAYFVYALFYMLFYQIMKKGVVMLFIGFIIGIAVTLLIIMLVLPRQMFVVKESRLGFDETIALLEKSVIDSKWSMPHQYDLQATMKKHGYEVSPVKVLSLCKPEHAYKILGSKDERVVSALMPCRVAVYEKDGKTYVSMLNSGLFSKFMGSNINQVMSAASEENKKILSPVIQ